MKAVVLDHFGGLDALVTKELPLPTPEHGEVLIRVRAFGLNHAEIHMRRGTSRGCCLPLRQYRVRTASSESD
jgi:NADPH:quinone reductase-like Zn-dependent oxidoreductase